MMMIMIMMMMVVVMIMIMMVMMMMMILMMMMIIIALKGSNRDFYNLLSAPRTVSNTHAQGARAQPCANHVQHIKRLSCTTCNVPLETKGQLSY